MQNESTSPTATPADHSPVVLPPVPDELNQLIGTAGLKGERALAIQSTFTPFFIQVSEWREKIKTVSDPKIARASRLFLKNLRVEAGHRKDDLKGDVLRYTNAVDLAHRSIKAEIEPMEVALEEIEKRAEREAAAKRAAVIADRTAKLQAYDVDPTFFSLGEMPEEHFQKLLGQSQAAFQAKKDAEAKAAEAQRIAAEKAEQDRIAREKAEAEERERVRLENERMKREKEEREAAEKAERERRARLNTERRSAIAALIISQDAHDIFYGEMSDEDYLNTVQQSRDRYAERIEQERRLKEERDRLAREKAEADAKAAAERAEKERRQDLHGRRFSEISSLGTPASEMRHFYGDMTDEQYAAELADAKKRKVERDAAAAKAAEEKRKADEAARLAAEQARKDREARVKAEEDLRAAENARQANEKADREAAEKAAQAPDREKLLAFAAVFNDLRRPEMATAKGRAAMHAIASRINELATFVNEKARGL